MNRLLEQMRELTQLRGVSGREEGVREYLIRSIEGHCDEYKVDPMGNLIVYKMGKKAGAKRVLFSAHMDEVGFIITHIAGDGMLHFETVGGITAAVTAGRPVLVGDREIPGVIGTTVAEGGTRPIWRIEEGERETFLMAWPKESLLRAGVVFTGPKNAQLEPAGVFPFLEGFANSLTVVETHPWKQGKTGMRGRVGEVLAQPDDDGAPIWFFDPLFYRDAKVDLTPGVTQVFYLSGLCYGIRRALLDELTVTQGPVYEAWAKKWLDANPGKGRLDVPPLKIPLRGSNLLQPAARCSEYEGRMTLGKVESFNFGPEGAEEKIYCFSASFGKDDKWLNLIMFAPERICNGYEPKEGDEVDLAFWMQGRVVDLGDELSEDDPASAGAEGTMAQ